VRRAVWASANVHVALIRENSVRPRKRFRKRLLFGRVSGLCIRLREPGAEQPSSESHKRGEGSSALVQRHHFGTVELQLFTRRVAKLEPVRGEGFTSLYSNREVMR
jgi:hypothetical protein